MANPELTDEQKRQQFEAACKAKPLKDQLPSLRAIEGFPIGTDDDILALSDPPYYTACPNPYINDFIAAFGKPYDPATDDYERTPFVGDISEGKNDPVYMVHAYFTKVPHKAIMKYIQHYTNSGDIIFDGFCGTGMTGVAARTLSRKAILCDLSPMATLISRNYNSPTDIKFFNKKASEILQDVEKECEWMFHTFHKDGKTKGRILYTVWSDVLVCPYCKNEYVLWEAAVNIEKNEFLEKYPCPHCKATINADNSERLKTDYFDSVLNKTVTQAKSVPVLIKYKIGTKSFEKLPDSFDYELIKKIETMSIPYAFPVAELPSGDNTEQPKNSHGFTHIHHLYTKRNFWIISGVFSKILESKIDNKLLKTWFTSSLIRTSKMYKFTLDRKMGNVNGTYYIPALRTENNPLKLLLNKFQANLKVTFPSEFQVIVQCQSSDNLTTIPSNSVDYIFTDPPFGGNLMYSELNFLWEAWFRVYSNNKSEAIMNKTQQKTLLDYKDLMIQNFKETYRILKPNRWITVEFHNSKAAVWNAIQDALVKSGFVVAQVTVLDKKQGTFKQVTTAGAVKNDLIINAYKPRQSFEERFLKRAGAELEKEFVAEHLSHLPKEPNIERTEQMLFSKMLAHYIQHGYEIRLNAHQFYNLMRDNFKLIDGYWFLDNEIARYEEWKKANGLQAIEAIAKGQQTLFVTDERSFLIWLYNYLSSPKTYSDIFTASRNIQSSSSTIEDQIPELKQLLDINFIYQDGKYRRPTTEAEREGVESRRERELQKDFEKILDQALIGVKKIKDVRKEAIAWGFTKAYQEKRFGDIVAVAKKLDPDILENNSEINDFVEIAQLKVGEGI